MNIYIDESGGFSNPQNKPHAISCVAGLVIPERIRAAVETDYVRLRHSWGLADTEVKGRRLDEIQVAQVINLLRSHDLVVDTCMVDLGIESDTQIELHKQGQIIRTTEHVDPTMPVYKNIIRLQNILKGLPNQLYIQSQLMVELCWRIAQTSTIYLDATKIFKEHIHLTQSDGSVGIQLADIVASTFRRALSIHLQSSGWKDLGRLMIYQTDSTVGCLTLGDIGEAPSSVRALPYGWIINYFHKTAKSIWI